VAKWREAAEVREAEYAKRFDLAFTSDTLCITVSNFPVSDASFLHSQPIRSLFAQNRSVIFFRIFFPISIYNTLIISRIFLASTIDNYP